jgi:heptaprenyl diphosphate synthase
MNTGTIVRVSILGAMAAALTVVETMLPRPVPWVRLGLGHAAVLVSLWSDGSGPALAVLLLKIIVAGLVTGLLFEPAGLLSAMAGVAAWMTMSGVHAAIGRNLVGPVGVSASGALAFGLVQVWLFGTFLVHEPLWNWGVLIIVPGIAAGVVTGLLAATVMPRLHWIRDH